MSPRVAANAYMYGRVQDMAGRWNILSIALNEAQYIQRQAKYLHHVCLCSLNNQGVGDIGFILKKEKSTSGYLLPNCIMVLRGNGRYRRIDVYLPERKACTNLNIKEVRKGKDGKYHRLIPTTNAIPHVNIPISQTTAHFPSPCGYFLHLPTHRNHTSRTRNTPVRRDTPAQQ